MCVHLRPRMAAIFLPRGQMAATEDPLANLYQLAEQLEEFVPGWEAPCLDPPRADFYTSVVNLMAKIRPGDHIAVQGPGGGYWHHGIYIGLQPGAGGEWAAVVDVWGESKEAATVRVRPLDDFLRGASRLARVKYAKGAARSRADTVAVALRLEERARQRGFAYNAAANNCEHFSVLCRARCTARCALQALQRLEGGMRDAPRVEWRAAGRCGKLLL